MQQLFTAIARLLRDESGVVPPGDALAQISGTVEVTFKDFSELARRRGWTVQFLAERFRGIIEEPTEFFTRVLACRYQGEYRGDVTIPYRSILEFYRTELTFRQQETGRERFCAGGCGTRGLGPEKVGYRGSP